MAEAPSPYTAVARNVEPGTFAFYHEEKHVQDEGLLVRVANLTGPAVSFLFASVLLLAYFLIGGKVGYALLLSGQVVGLSAAVFFLFWYPEARAHVYALRKTGDWRAFLGLKG